MIMSSHASRIEPYLTCNGSSACSEQVSVLPRLRAAAARLTSTQITKLAAEANLDYDDEINVDDPRVLTAIRRAVLAPEPGDAPHSALVTAISDAGWTSQQIREASAQIWETREESGHDEFWTALAHEVAAAGRIEGPPDQSSTVTVAVSRPISQALPTPISPAAIAIMQRPHIEQLGTFEPILQVRQTRSHAISRELTQRLVQAGATFVNGKARRTTR